MAPRSAAQRKADVLAKAVVFATRRVAWVV
jgi:hypothetical protein